MPAARIVYVIGPPGAGKSTQCTKLAEELDITHLSIGDLLRTEQHQDGSPWQEAVSEHYQHDKPLNDQVYVDVLLKELSPHNQNGKTQFLLDGFPRNIKQGEDFERQDEVSINAVLVFECPKEVLFEQILSRGQDSGRADDSETRFEKRYERFWEGIRPVLELWGDANKLSTIDSSQPIEDLYPNFHKIVNKIFPKS